MQKPKTKRLAGALVALAGAAVSVTAWAAVRSLEPSADELPVVARYGDRVVTLEEVDRKLGDSLYEMRAKALHDLLTNELAEKVARERNLTVEQLREHFVGERAEPTREELLAIYEQGTRAGYLDPDVPFEQTEESLREKLRLTKGHELEREFRDKLLVTSKVRMDLDRLGRPQLTLRESGPTLGAEQPSVTIHEYTDFESPFCADAHRTIERVLHEYGDTAKVVFHQTPSKSHPHARKAAEAALCAHDQGRYWEYRQTLFNNQEHLDRPSLQKHARTAGLDAERFAKCLDSGAKSALIDADIDEAKRNGIEGEPGFAVNGTRLSGAHKFDMFRMLIEVELPPRG